MNCNVTEGCTGIAALRTSAAAFCVRCARWLDKNGHVPARHMIPMIRPTGDNVVIFPDVQEQTGRIILVSQTRSFIRDRKGMRRREDDFSTGIVLAVGPGIAARKSLLIDSMGKACAPTFKGRNGQGENERVYSEPGMRVAFRYVYEAAIQEWRDLLIVHDFDVLGVLEEEAA